MKKICGFSLVELMITLIIISCIIGAMTPMITKKLKSQGITVGSGSVSANLEFKQDCSKWQDCALCFEDKCAVCAKECNLDEYVDTPNCICQSCSKHENCLECTSKQCSKCSLGYFSNNGVCEICPIGYICDGAYKVACEEGKYTDNEGSVVCKTCESKTEYCTKCDIKTGLCSECEENYTLNTDDYTCKKKTKTPTSQADCTPFNAIYIPAKYNGVDNVDLCVTKYNVGDTNGPNIYNEGNARLVTSGTYCDNSYGYCCWSVSPTLCGYYAARESCQNWTYNNSQKNMWDLPSENIINGWSVSYSNSSEFQNLFYGTTGVYPCIACDWTTECNGAGNGNACMKHVMWSTNPNYTLHCNSTLGTLEWANYTYSLSTRCVAQEVPVLE